MNDNKNSSSNSSSDSASEAAPDGGGQERKLPREAARQKPGWKKLRLIVLGLLVLLGSSVLSLGMLTGSAAWYTSRSEFCDSCHIMDPYYASWQHSSHSDVACIKCHFAPGIGEKVRGKMQGLVQLCTYITRSEGPRPVAEVSDASCLRSGCHDKQTLPGPLEFHGIIFDHGPHMGELHLQDDTLLTRDASPSAAEQLPDDEAHQSMKLRCTSCHGQTDPSVHIAVNVANCYLCHFKDEPFNQGKGACTHCHQIPEERFELGGDITFTHEQVYENGIDCQNCHGGLNKGTGDATLVRCQVCHNQDIHLAKIDDTQLMHDLHVSEHKIECLDCHTEITHSLKAHELVDAATDCASCHPNQHREQVNMIQGTGGLSTSDVPASHNATGIQCLACHRNRQISSTGNVIWEASAQVCSSCHTTSATAQLQSYQNEVRSSLADIRAALERAREAVKVIDLSSEQLAEARETLDRLEHDVEFLRVGNGIHNIHYASTLTRELLDDAVALAELLNVEPPSRVLPENVFQID